MQFEHTNSGGCGGGGRSAMIGGELFEPTGSSPDPFGKDFKG